MDTIEAGNILSRMYRDAPPGEQTTHIHLFGIKYAEELESLSVSQIVKQAGVPHTYVTEVHKGRRLAKYVTLKGGE